MISQPQASSGQGDALRLSLASAPVLAIMAAIAAAIDLLVSRIALRGISKRLSHAQSIELKQLAEFFPNLAGVAGSVALIFAVFAIMRARELAPLRRRLAVAVFSGLFVPLALLALIFPAERSSPELVFVGVGAANVLCILALTSGAHFQQSALRVLLGLCVAISFITLTTLLIASAPSLENQLWALSLLRALKSFGELLYLAIPFSVVVVWARHDWMRPAPKALLIGAFAAALVTALLGYCAAALGYDYRLLLYSALQFEVMRDIAPNAYALIVGLVFWAGAASLLSGSAVQRQFGAALWLLLAAGYAPKSPGRLLMWVLAAFLIHRAAIALGAMQTIRSASIRASSAPRQPRKPRQPG